MYEMGEEMYDLASKLFPVCRSITGDGVRESLDIIEHYLNGCAALRRTEVRSGTKVYDWVIPKEWKIREAYIEDEQGTHIVDMKNHNLHVMGYSAPVDQWVDLQQLKQYIYVQDDQPDVIPYVTSYYKKKSGFCMSRNQKNALKEGRYHMYIDSELFEGSMTYGEIVLPGESDKEIFFSTYTCHPSMANNECSGPALAAALVRYISLKKKRKYTYRFLFAPETIGAIAYLSLENHLNDLKEHMLAGFVLTCAGDNGDYSMVSSRYGNTLADRVLDHILKRKSGYKKYTYLMRGSDERQFNAPGIDLPVVCYSRTKFHEYPQYHTSADNMEFVSREGFQGSYDVFTDIIMSLEYNGIYKTTVLCEPQLCKRGLYETTSQKGSSQSSRIMMNILAYADGSRDLIGICDLIDICASESFDCIDTLMNHHLLEIVNQ